MRELTAGLDPAREAFALVPLLLRGNNSPL